MRKRYLFIAALSITMVLVLSGCFGNVWSVSFALPANYDDWYQDDWGGSLTSVFGLGVRLDNYALCSPVAFDGDFTVTVTFTLNTDSANTAFLGCLIGDDDQYYPTNHVYCNFGSLGNEGQEDWEVRQNHVPVTGTVVTDSTLATLMRKGINRLKIIKTGQNIQVWMNFYRSADFELTSCAAAKYYICLYADLVGTADLIFNSVKVNYNGSII